MAPLDERCAPLALWTGAECTINRVGDRWHDQSIRTGTVLRPDDLDRMASLGARRIRLPVLWERVVPTCGGTPDWRGPDEALGRLRSLKVPAIVGLLHHGSGPNGTHLADPSFPSKFAHYARRVAQRYPDQQFWTPINEPVTTARFSGLYGHWYPHVKSDRGFVRMLLQQIHGTVAAMREIRAVIPSAELIQTEDVGHTRATPALRDQAEFDNHRRWLGFDLLCGRVDSHHALWPYLIASGASPAELDALHDAPCAPDLIGINAYITSERFLDERLDLYPPRMHGGNGIDRYVDVETARADGETIHGFQGRIEETWARYGRPLALTEVHLGCTREEQMRWLGQAWTAAAEARARGVDIRAVTAWAAFGTLDWNSLLTQESGHYESGLWDVRSDPPRRTALGELAAQLAAGDSARHPVGSGAGWWERDLRLQVPAIGQRRSRPVEGTPVLVTGADESLVRAFVRLCHMRGLACVALSRQDVDIADPTQVQASIDRHRPWAIVDASGDAREDKGNRSAGARRSGTEGAVVLARRCNANGLRLLVFSSARVFAGTHALPYVERDAIEPADAEGAAHAHVEREVCRIMPGALIVRTSAVFGPWDHMNHASRALAAVAHGEPWHALSDQVVSPTYAPDLVQACLDLLIDGESGLWHLTSEEHMTWADFAFRLVEGAGLPGGLVIHASSADLEPGDRPRSHALRSERGRIMPMLSDALRRFEQERAPFDTAIVHGRNVEPPNEIVLV